MTLKKGSKISGGYATIIEDDGDNYREIADTMTELGYQMNHSSARNYVIRVMRKFVTALAKVYDIDLDPIKINEVAKSPNFQKGIAEVLHIIENERRNKN